MYGMFVYLLPSLIAGGVGFGIGKAMYQNSRKTSDTAVIEATRKTALQAGKKSIMEKALLRIGSGTAGNPVLEAQVALEEANSLTEKEIAS